MRAFIRLASTETVLTFDLPQSSTVFDLKEAIVESGQLPSHLSAAHPADLSLHLHASELSDATTLEACASPSTQSSNALHVMVQARHRQANQLERTAPGPGATNVPLETGVHCVLPANIIAAGGWTIELRGWMDQAVCGQVSFDASTRELRLRPQSILLPGRVYCVIVRAAQQPRADFVWQFCTAQLPAVRIILKRRREDDRGPTSTCATAHHRATLDSLAAQRFGEDNERRLVTLQRRAALLSELQATARSVFREADAEYCFSTSEAPICDSGVAALCEGDVVVCSRKGTMSSAAIVHDDVPALSYEEYCRAHWVNEAAGYYAVAGKLTPHEEEQMLLAVVAAFEDAPAPTHAPLPAAAAPAPAALSHLTEEVPHSHIQARWGSSAAPPCCRLNEPGRLLQVWRRSSFVVVSLPEEAQAAVSELFDAWASFCELPRTDKESGEGRAYLGYHHRPHFCKELFQLRGCSSAATAFPPTASRLRAAAERTYDALAACSAEALRIVCAAMRMPSEQVTKLIEPPLAAQASHTPLSQSNLTIFRYSPALGDEAEVAAAGGVTPNVHCPYHTDVGLVTIIPCGTSPGLHVFDHEPGYEGWVDVEADMPPGHAVIFGGESLHRLSNHWLLPGVHEVSSVAAERLSCPFQLLAARDANLDSSSLDVGVVGELHPECALPLCAAEFVERVSASRVSSNFPRSGGDQRV